MTSVTISYLVVLKQYASACEDLERALRISPLSTQIHVARGYLLLTMNEMIEAEKHFSRALDIRVHVTQLCMNGGVIYDRNKLENGKKYWVIIVLVLNLMMPYN